MAITLTGEQNRILNLPLNNPVQIKGGAGSGKTTVAIFRARHLVASSQDWFRDTNVAIFSYTKSLVRYVESILGPDQLSLTPIIVVTFHKWAYSFLKQRGVWKTRRVADQQEIDQLIEEAKIPLRLEYPLRAVLDKQIEFFREEFAWIKGRRLLNEQEYSNAKRTGRGTTDRVTAQDKEIIWKMFATYTTQMTEKGLVDFEDFGSIALSLIESDPSFVPPFSHLVVDEAQDMTPVQLLVLTRLVNAETNSITIVADAAQRIYKSGFSWSDIGINIRGGRTVELKRNYRNTKQIAQAAISLLANDPQQTEFSAHILPERDGSLPNIISVNDDQSQIEYIVRVLRDIDLTMYSAVVLHRSRRRSNELHMVLAKEGFSPVSITASEHGNLSDPGLYTCTMPSVKGLEFDHVIICDLNDAVVPYPEGFTDENDELHISTERRLLYTCMTRARHSLTLISSAQPPCRFLDEIDPVTVQRADSHAIP
ncbi:MAG: DEAD/DEAH box helicase [bacterium]